MFQRKFRILLVGLLVLCSERVFSQTGNEINELSELSLEELMNITVVSSSKKEEKLFDASFSAFVLSADEIAKAGCLSVMDALRLIPGVIVKEQINGNYDIHLRGLSNVPPNSVFPNAANTTTLVMVDNRPVYNYLQGGTFWETLPIDINDVQRIEVIHGPLSAMYGPNAVSGVIHFITHKQENIGLQANGDFIAGTQNTAIARSSVSYKFSTKLSMRASANYQFRSRFEDTYLEIDENNWKKIKEFPISNIEERYPKPTRALDKYGVNTFITYNPFVNTSINIAAGFQESEAQNIYQEKDIRILVSNSKSRSRYIDLTGSVGNLKTQVSYLTGTQNPSTGVRGARYDFNTLDVLTEYDIKINNLLVSPGLNYRHAVYDDTKYWNAAEKEGTISGREELYTYALSLRTDYRFLSDKLRLTAGGRLDRFNYPKDEYLSYNLSSSYKINSNNLVRAVVSRANRSPFIYDTFIELQFRSQIPMPLPDGQVMNMPFSVYINGNNDLKLVTSDMYEIGYRWRTAKNIDVDVQGFYSLTKNFTELIQGPTQAEMSGNSPFPTSITSEIKVTNLPMKVNQTGVTLSVNFVAAKVQVKPYVTYQQTILHDYSPYNNSSDASPTPSNLNPGENHYRSGIGNEDNLKGTPEIFGGFNANYQPIKKLQFNLNLYAFGKSTFRHRFNLEYRDNVRGMENLNSKYLLNAKVAYAVHKNVSLHITGRNLTNNKTREYYGGELIGASVLGGLSLRY